MDRNKARNLIADLLSRVSATNEQLSKAYELFGNSDTAFNESIWSLQDLAARSTAALAGDQIGIVEWFICDCEMGNRPMEHSLDNGEMVVVDSIEKLLDVMEGYGAWTRN